MNTNCRYIADLTEHLLSAQSRKEMEVLLLELLTPTEIGEIAKRLQIFKLLKSGMPQRQIADTLGVGIATVTRGSRALQERQQ